MQRAYSRCSKATAGDLLRSFLRSNRRAKNRRRRTYCAARKSVLPTGEAASAVFLRCQPRQTPAAYCQDGRGHDCRSTSAKFDVLHISQALASRVRRPHHFRIAQRVHTGEDTREKTKSVAYASFLFWRRWISLPATIWNLSPG